MKKMVGYVVSIAGLVVMAIGFGMFKIENELVSSIAGTTGTFVGVGLVIVGVVLALMVKGGRRQKAAEVPIYEGRGKSRKIVGYQRG